MTPVEFDAACRELERRSPWLWQTSGYRGKVHNADVGGDPESKHVLGMARDYGAVDLKALNQGAAVALELGLWLKVHDVGSGDHLHVQGLATGEVAAWWLAKYGG